MDFIFNSHQKKVEIFYENEIEQKALFDFLSKYIKFKTGGVLTDSTFINGPEISWTTPSIQPPYAINTTNDLSGTITSNNDAVSVIDIEKAISNSINPNLCETVISLKLSNSSDESGYSGITAYVPKKTE